MTYFIEDRDGNKTVMEAETIAEALTKAGYHRLVSCRYKSRTVTIKYYDTLGRLRQHYYIAKG